MEICIRKLWIQGRSNINVYIQLAFLAHLVNNRKPVTERLLRESHSPLRTINESLEQIYYYGFVIKAEQQVAEVLFKAVKETNPPSITALCHFLEFHVTLSLVSFARINEGYNIKLALPEYYVELIHVWDSLYEAEYSFNSAVAKIDPRMLSGFVNFIDSILRLLFGLTSEHFNVMQSMVDAIEGRSNVDSLDCYERFLTLLLVILSNLESIDLSSYGSRIVNMFLQYGMTIKTHSSRLSELFTNISRVANSQAAGNLLKESLRYKNGKVLECYWHHNFRSLSIIERISEKNENIRNKGSVTDDQKAEHYHIFRRSCSNNDYKKTPIDFKDAVVTSASTSVDDWKQLVGEQEKNQQLEKIERTKKDEEESEKYLQSITAIQRWARRMLAKNQRHSMHGSLRRVLETNEENILTEFGQLLQNSKGKIDETFYLEIENRYSMISHQFKNFKKEEMWTQVRSVDLVKSVIELRKQLQLGIYIIMF